MMRGYSVFRSNRTFFLPVFRRAQERMMTLPFERADGSGSDIFSFSLFLVRDSIRISYRHLRLPSSVKQGSLSSQPTETGFLRD